MLFLRFKGKTTEMKIFFFFFIYGTYPILGTACGPGWITPQESSKPKEEPAGGLKQGSKNHWARWSIICPKSQNSMIS